MALAKSDTLEITGDGVTNPVTFTREDLEQMEQHQYLYSAINTWPTKKWYVGKGVKLWDLLLKAGIKQGEAKLLRFYATDGYMVTLTFKELFQDKRYRFPNFKTGGDADGHVPGDPSGQVEVPALVALLSVEGSDNPKYMNDLNTFLLMLGQRAVTEQTGNLFVKYLNKIEVLTTEPEKWDAPQANPPPGLVPPGTMVTLSNLHMDDDKIYYTLDGSTPTLESPMYNWIASRWWAARADALGTVNRPIGPINEDTTIKAVTIGPGKLDSDVVTFHYRVAEAPDRPAEAVPPQKVVRLAVGRVEAEVDGASYTLEAAPFVDPGSGRTLVPLRFVSEALGAGVSWDPESRRITVTEGGKEIVLRLGSAEVEVNGAKQTIDCAPAALPPGRTFVPLRFVSEALGAKVDYEAGSGQVLITR
ncbi:MAG: stalk domain-containing protein [Clostridia bacterium]|nr:stalk domain-containing protein [Clostridia bacterium]